MSEPGNIKGNIVPKYRLMGIMTFIIYQLALDGLSNCFKSRGQKYNKIQLVKIFKTTKLESHHLIIELFTMAWKRKWKPFNSSWCIGEKQNLLLATSKVLCRGTWSFSSQPLARPDTGGLWLSSAPVVQHMVAYFYVWFYELLSYSGRLR